MSLYLSRLALNPLSAAALRLAGSPDDLHRAICRLFDGGRSEAGFLFRVDAGEWGPDVLIQARREPDWTRLGLDERALREPPRTKPFDPQVSEGRELGFRLLARPVRRASTGTGNPPGSRRDLRTDEERLAWLHRKAESAGFRVTACGLTLLTFPAVHSAVPFQPNRGSFTAVRFDGELIVTDPERLREAVAQGIGTQKSFGFGLLSLAAR